LYFGKSKNVNYSICGIALTDVINGLPRKLLGYSTPEALFDAQLDRIYSV